RGELIRSCTVRSWRRRIRLFGRFPYRPTIGGACGMYRPSIGPVSAIERAIVCMRMPGLADLRQPISMGFLHTATSGRAPGLFYARCARNQVDRSLDRTIRYCQIRGRGETIISTKVYIDEDKKPARLCPPLTMPNSACSASERPKQRAQTHHTFYGCGPEWRSSRSARNTLL